jgi:hypothetical protein
MIESDSGVVRRFQAVFILSVFIISCIFVGYISGLSPEAAVRFLPIILVVVVSTLSLARRPIKNPDCLTGILVTVMCGMAVFWPTYFTFKLSGLPSIDGRKLAFVILFLVLLYRIFGDSIWLARYRHSTSIFKAVLYILMCYTFLRFASAFSSKDVFFSVISVFWECLYYYFVLVFFALFCDVARAKKHISSSIINFGFILSLFVAYEYFSGENLFTRFLPIYSDMKEMMMLSRIRDGSLRAQGSFEHPLAMAEYAVVFFSFSLAAVLFDKGKSKKFICFFGFLCAIFCALASGSRSSVIALMLSAACIFSFFAIQARGFNRSSYEAMAIKLSLFAVFLIAVVALIPILMILAEGRTAAESMSSEARISMYFNGLKAIAESPILGSGVGESVYMAGLEGSGGVLTIDNYFLVIAIDSGVPALIMFLLIAIIPILLGLNLIVRFGDIDKSFVAACVASLVALLVFRSIMSIPYNLYFVFAISGIILSYSNLVRLGNGRAL